MMYKKAGTPRFVLSGALALTSFAVVPSTALATGTCYVAGLDGIPSTTGIDGTAPFAIRYITKSAGAITSDAEAYNFNHLKQAVFSASGKATVLLVRDVVRQALNGEESFVRIMSTVAGTVVTGAPKPGTNPADAPGAHAGFVIHLGRSDLSGSVFLGPIFLECTTSQVSATPNQWLCSAKLEGLTPAQAGLALGFSLPVNLYKVDPTKVPACSVFQDGAYFPSLPIDLSDN